MVHYLSALHIHALNEPAKPLGKKEVNKTYETLNKVVFTPRNHLAHGKIAGSTITSGQASDAIRACAQFVWDWSETDRELLLAHTGNFHLHDLIDEDLIAAWREEATAA